MKQLLFILFSLLSFVGKAQNGITVFNQANAAYDKGNYNEAINLYHQVENEQESAELYYNLGNCYYQIDSIAPAILYFEKSIKLKPSEDAAFNLAICNQKVIDRIEAKKELVLNTWWESFRSVLTTKGWAWLTIIFMFIASIAWLIYQRSNKEALVRASFSVGILSFFCALLLLLMTNHVHNTQLQAAEGVIFAANVDVKSSPTAGGKTLFILHQGTKVGLRDQKNGWQEIILADGKIGWIPESKLKII